jgi:hypothetical protein
MKSTLTLTIKRFQKIHVGVITPLSNVSLKRDLIDPKSVQEFWRWY